MTIPKINTSIMMRVFLGLVDFGGSAGGGVVGVWSVEGTFWSIGAFWVGSVVFVGGGFVSCMVPLWH